MSRWQRWRVVPGLIAVIWLLLSYLPIAPTPPIQAAATIRWGYYVTYAPSSLATLRAHLDELTHVSPWYFTLKEDGSLGSTEQPATTALLRSRNIKVLPMVQNVARNEQFRAMLDTPEKLNGVVERIAAIAMRPEYDGIHIDFEGISADDRGLLTDFMARLSGRLRPAGKIVSQAVAARTGEVRTGWAAPYDYAELGKYNDLIVIMAYDYHFAGGQPGPVAPIDWVERVSQYARASFGPATTVLGMPLYGYDWRIGAPPGSRASAVSYDDVLALERRHNGLRGYDEGFQSDWLRYREHDVEHVVWFESYRSLQAKLQVMERLGLAGFAVWRLGHEDGAFWRLVQSTSNPASPAPWFASTRERLYFNETRHSLRGAFLRYWQANGGLARFGFPLTEEFEEANPESGRSFVVQYFERARFEYHPELANTPHEVLLGHLGRWAIGANAIPPPTPIDGQAPLPADARFFAETQQVIRGGFRAYWEANGGWQQFGLPLTGELDERSSEDGQLRVVQYFERVRFEYHPQHRGTPYEIQLSLLGRQQLRGRSWLR